MSTTQQPARERRPDASMTLLTEVMERPLDRGYAEAARRRAEGGAPASNGSGGWLSFLSIVLIGVALSAAALQLRADETTTGGTRSALEQRIAAATQDADIRQERVSALRAEIEQVRADALAASGSSVPAQVQELAVLVGAAPVTGPGVELTLDDSPGLDRLATTTDPQERDEISKGRVLDRDLQLAVNGLWAAGAEAVAVNGVRLTSLSAIRAAGLAILVDFRPLVPPYVVQAVGDPAAIQTRFAASGAGRSLRTVQVNYGVEVSVVDQDDLELPGAGALRLREAEVLPGPGPDATAPSSPSPPVPEASP